MLVNCSTTEAASQKAVFCFISEGVRMMGEHEYPSFDGLDELLRSEGHKPTDDRDKLILKWLLANINAKFDRIPNVHQAIVDVTAPIKKKVKALEEQVASLQDN